MGRVGKTIKWLRLPLAQEGILICFSPLFKGKVRDASASTHIGHKGGKWVFSELKNEPVLSYFYCITSCLLAHCLFGRFFWRPFPYTQVEATPLWRTHGESSPLSKATARVCAEISTCFIRRVPDPRRVLKGALRAVTA